MERRFPYRYTIKQELNKIILLWTILFLLNRQGIGQTTNISGVVNTYYSVIEVIPVKACVRVSSTAGLNLYSKVLLIQMKGASVITTNTATFGDTTLLNNAGNYEVATICNIIGDSVFMFYNFLNNYTVSGKVQLVQFGQYTNAVVTDTLKATAWNNATGTGGVIALYVTGDLTLNAPINANEAGFKGGTYYLSTDFCFNSPFDATAYKYTASSTNPQNGASKGESVYELASTETGGRGAPANGGGGGNNHNNAGGGGANLNNGGIGGGNSSSKGCTSTLRGLAGKALSSWNGKKIFFGGGGGAGHANSGIALTGGGNGGGIIFIRTTSLFGNGHKILANAGAGGNSISDGAGGGGGGGTIIMNVTNYSGTENFEAKGGIGGNSNDNGNLGYCYGGGGGGSGGMIYFSNTPVITTSVNGGAAGVEMGRSGTCVAAVPAGTGSNGSVINNYTFSRSYTVASYCTGPLQVLLENFSATAFQQKALLKWKILNPSEVFSFEIEKLNFNNEWETIIVIQANNSVEDYMAWDNQPTPGKNSYRLKIIESNNKITYSSIRQVDFSFVTKDFNIYPNPAKKTITIRGDFNSPILLQLFDYAGKIVFSKRLFPGQTSFDLPSLPPGIYIVRINEKMKKLVIH